MGPNKRLLAPLVKTRLHEEIMGQLKDKIIRGELSAGAKLPPERELAEQLQVNRNTVREALHKLESIGLVEIKHGNGIYVKDFLESDSLELARHLLFLDGKVNLAALKNLLELRRVLVPEFSYYAARNRSEQDLKELERIVFHSDGMPLSEKDWRVHNLIARASGNQLFVIILNSFTWLTRAASQPYFEIERNRQRSARFHREIYAAIKQGDAPGARKIMTEVLAFAEQAVWKALGIKRARRAR